MACGFVVDDVQGVMTVQVYPQKCLRLVLMGLAGWRMDSI